MGVSVSNPFLVTHSFVLDGPTTIVMTESAVLEPGSVAPVPQMTRAMAEAVAALMPGVDASHPVTIYEDHFPA